MLLFWMETQVSIAIYNSSVVAVQLLSCVWLFVTPWTAASQVSLSFTISQSFLKLMSIELVMPSNYLILCRPLLLLVSIFSSTKFFSSELALHIRRPKYWGFSMSPSNEYSGLISFRIDWYDLLAVQGTLKSLLQHHSSKASILQCSAFFMVQLSHSCMTTGKKPELWLWKSTLSFKTADKGQYYSLALSEDKTLSFLCPPVEKMSQSIKTRNSMDCEGMCNIQLQFP